jgi:hypothetical protein
MKQQQPKRRTRECWECTREMSNCAIAYKTAAGQNVYVCPECWKNIYVDDDFDLEDEGDK